MLFSRITVLLIEDDPDDVGLIREALDGVEHPSVVLVHANCLTAGLARLAQGRFDAVLLDLGLPECSGLETLQRVYRHSPNVPIVVLTGFDVEDFAVEALQAGAQDYLAKNRIDGPLVLRTLRYAIERARRQRAERALRESNRTRRRSQAKSRDLERIVNRSPAVVFLWRVAEGWPVEFVSDNISQFGYTAADLMSGRVSWPGITHPDDVPRLEAEAARFLREGVTEFSQQYRLLTRSGEVRWVEDRNLALADPSGHITHVQGIVLDVTDRRLAEARLQASEAQVRTISEAALDAVVMVDSEGSVAHWNPAAERMFGYAAAEIIGRRVHALLVPDQHRPRAEQAFRQFAASGSGSAVGKVLELTALRKDGSEFPMEISVAPIAMGDRWGAAAIVRDITRRRRTEQELDIERRQLVRLLDMHERYRQLISYELHDGLAQPLVATQMNLEGALGEAQPLLPEAVSQRVTVALEMLRASIAESRRLITGLRPPILDQFGIVLAIQNLVSEMTASGGPQTVWTASVQFDRLAGPLETALFRIAQEAIDNACKHSGSDEVRVALTQQGDRVKIEVEDSGAGFAPEEVGPGCYGLEGIRQRARLFGGTADVRTAPGHGTCVSVELPVVLPAPSPDADPLAEDDDA